ncbi:MAG: tRNA wybutosine-synthesizing 3 family protein [archaeon]
MKDHFQTRKKDTLSKQDKSSKQSWDKKIAPLCSKINNLKNYYTTSSCSGRIILMLDQSKKSHGLFLKVYHDKITFEELKDDLLKLIPPKKQTSNFSLTTSSKRGVAEPRLIKFKQEPCIIHVACTSLPSAQDFYNKARLAGWKKHGIIASGKRFVVEATGTDKLEFPIINKGKILVGDEFLKLVVKKSNENLEKSWEMINRLEESL